MTDEMREVLPALYAAWMTELLPGPIPAETEATCEDCAMCHAEADTAGASDLVFNESTKCCTYIVELPNFLVGLILINDDPASAAGRRSLRARLDASEAVSPLGIGRSPTEPLLYEHTVETAAFGRNPHLRCPHYLDAEGGQCGIWQQRPAACATWFCKFNRGVVGLRFWRSTLNLLLRAEIGLMRWCVLQLNPGSAALARLLPPPGGEPAPPEEHPECGDAGLWGLWDDKRMEFFIECGRLVEPLSWTQVVDICGPDIGMCSDVVLHYYQALVSPRLPESLKVGNFNIIGMGPQTNRVVAYSPLDPLELPRVLLNVLPYFDGRPTREALAAIAMDTGIRLDEDLVRKLLDFGILKSAATKACHLLTPHP